jgi:transcription antitermination factor NusG
MTWWAIQTKSNREFDVQRTINFDIGFRAECPHSLEIRSRKRGGSISHTEIIRPMFTGYIFVAMLRSDLHLLREERNIYWPLPNWNAPREITEAEINAAMSISGIKLGEWKALQRFHAGDLIRRKGDRSGLSFEVTEATAERVVALSKLLGIEKRHVFRPELIEAAE